MTARTFALGALAFSGLIAVLGADPGVTMFFLLVAAVAGLVHALSRDVSPPPTVVDSLAGKAHPGPATLPPVDYAQGRPVARVHRDPTDLSDLDLPSTPSSDLSRMSDQALCQAWRISYVRIRRLQQLPHAGAALGRASIERGRYLGELERRNPAGFGAWMAAGARAASDPSRYLVREADAGERPVERRAEQAAEDPATPQDEPGSEQDVTDSRP